MNEILTREELLNLISKLPGHIYWKDKNGHYLGSNDNQAKFLGFKHGSDLIGKTDFDLPWKSKANQLKEIDMHVMNKKETYSVEEIVKDLKGVKRIFLSQKQPFYDTEHKVKGILGTSIEITAIRQAEIAKKEFLMNVAHDVRTPLTGIMGITDLLVNSGTIDDFRKDGQMILDAAKKLLDTMNSFLEVITADYRVDGIVENVVCCEELAKDIETLMQPPFVEKKLDFQVNVDKNMPLICTDKIKIKLMIIDLISNALKFTKKGKVGLEINLLSREVDKAKIEIRVNDTGIGIPEDKLDKIFDLLSRIHPSYEGQYSGSGIGLYLVKNTVELLGGEIKVQSEVGKGSCFIVTFSFPLILNSSSQKQVLSVEDGNLNGCIIKQKRVLIVEDDELNRHIIKKLLLSLNYHVLVESTGEAALETLKQTQAFDWVLIDITLPNIKGTEVIIRYRQWEREHNKPKLPIFAFESDPPPETIKTYIEIGFNDVLIKPFTTNSIKIINLSK